MTLQTHWLPPLSTKVLVMNFQTSGFFNGLLLSTGEWACFEQENEVMSEDIYKVDRQTQPCCTSSLLFGL